MEVNNHDYSDNKIIGRLNEISYSFFTDTYTALTQVKNDKWFYDTLIAKDMAYLLSIANNTGQDIAVIYDALMVCYSHQSSTKGLVLLCKALFGDDSTITADASNPGTLLLVLSNTNASFLNALVSYPANDWILANQDGLTVNNFINIVGTSDLTRFFEQFLPPGRKVILGTI